MRKSTAVVAWIWIAFSLVFSTAVLIPPVSRVQQTSNSPTLLVVVAVAALMFAVPGITGACLLLRRRSSGWMLLLIWSGFWGLMSFSTVIERMGNIFVGMLSGKDAFMDSVMLLTQLPGAVLSAVSLVLLWRDPPAKWSQTDVTPEESEQ